jgi:signal recognition particle subunit SRP19
MKGERVLYPCYFNAGLARNEGRRVPRSIAVKNPTLADLEKAAKKCRVEYRVEEKKPHPTYWARREGRIVVTWTLPKERLLKDIARCMEGGR